MAIELATAYIALVPSALGIASNIKAALGGADVEAAAASSGAKASSSFFGAFKGAAGLIAAAGIGDVLAKAVKGASDFQAETELLVTAGGEAQSALAGVRAGLEQIAVGTGTSLAQLSNGMYTLEKAGLRGADGLNVLRAAAEGAKAENVDLGTMTNALTSIMRSYNLPASQATNITNQLVAASGAAKTTMQDFAGSLSAVLPVASSAGLSFAQVGGAIATLTLHGTSAQEASQELANTIRSLQAPSLVASKEMAQFGLNSNTVSQQLGKLGLTGTLKELTTAITSQMGPAGLVLRNAFNQSQGAAADMQVEISKMPPSLQTLAQQFESGALTMTDWRKVARNLPADQRLMMQGFMATYGQAHKFNDLLTSGSPAAQTYTAALEQMVGGATGLNTALQLTGGSSQIFAKNVATIAEAGTKGGKDISTWAQTQQNFNVQLSRLGEVAQTTAVNVGSALLPKLTAVGNFLADHAGAVKVAAGAFAVFATAMLTAAVAAKTISAVEKVAAVATKVWTAAQWLLNVALDANPISLIVIGITALVAGLVLAYEKSQTFRNIISDVFQFLVKWGPLALAGIFPLVGVPLLLVQHWSQIAGFFSGLLDGVVGFFTALPGRVLGALKALPNLLEQGAEDAIAGFIVGLAYAGIGVWAFFTKAPGIILGELAALPGQLSAVGSAALRAMAAGVSAGFGAVAGFVVSIPGRIVGGLGALGGLLVGAGIAVMQGLAAGLPAGFRAVTGFIAGLPGAIGGAFAGCVNWLVGAGEQIMHGLLAGIQSGLNDVKNFVGGIAGKIVSWKGPPAYDATILVGNGQLIMAGLVHGIRSQMPALQSQLADVTQTVAGGVTAGSVAAAGGVSVGGAGGLVGRSAPVVGQINVTALDPAVAARQMAAEIGWLNKTRGQ